MFISLPLHIQILIKDFNEGSKVCSEYTLVITRWLCLAGGGGGRGMYILIHNNPNSLRKLYFQKQFNFLLLIVDDCVTIYLTTLEGTMEFMSSNPREVKGLSTGHTEN